MKNPNVKKEELKKNYIQYVQIRISGEQYFTNVSIIILN